MNKSPLLLLILLAAVAGVFFLWSSVGGEVIPNAAEAWLEQEPDSDEPLDLTAVDDLGDESSEAETPAGLLQMGRTELPVEGDMDVLVVQVWEGKRGIPAADAEVFVVSGFDEGELEDPYGQHWSSLAESRGLRYRTDLEGRVELPPVIDWAIVTAKLPGAYGFLEIGPKHRDVETITLQPDETVTVLVLDDEDEPVADAPVGLLQRLPQRVDQLKRVAEWKQLEKAMENVKRWMEANPEQEDRAMPRVEAIILRMTELKMGIGKAIGEPAKNQRNQKARAKKEKALRWRIIHRMELRAQRRTDEAGIAVFRHFQLYRERAKKWWPDEYRNQFEAVLLVPMQQPKSRGFSGRPVPSEIIELRMPPTGSIALRTVDQNGRPFMQPVHAELRVTNERAPGWSRVEDRSEVGEAGIVFEKVGLGLTLKANCSLDDEDFRWQTPPFAGPINPGERVTIDVLVAPGAGMLHGRLIDGAGDPLAGVEATFLINSHIGRLEGEEVTLDDKGRFHLPYKLSRQHRGPFRLEIRREDVSPTAGIGKTLPSLPPGQVTDLGDLVIDAFNKIAYGTVVDDRGQPVIGAEIQLQRQRDVGDERPELEFVPETFAVVESDADGRYELFGELESARYRLRAEAEDHFPLESPDLRQGEPIDLTLQRKSRVVGTVLRPDWMSNKGLRVRLESVTNPQDRRDNEIEESRGKDYIFFDWIRPGLYNLSVSVSNFPDPFLKIDGIEIMAGQKGLHPRLTDLDLGAYLYRFEVTAVDENGQPIAPERPLLAKIVRPDGRSAFVGVPWKSPQIEVISASAQLEVIPMANGYRAEPTILAQGRNEVQFARIPPVELVVPGLRQLVGETRVELVMELQTDTDMPDQLETWNRLSNRISRWYADTRNARAQLGNGDSVELALGRDGRYLVIARLMSSTKRVRPVSIELGEVEVELTPGTDPQRITVNADPEQIQQGLAELAQREAR